MTCQEKREHDTCHPMSLSLSPSDEPLSHSSFPATISYTSPQHRRTPLHFLFGYGTLICHESRAITAPNVSHRPAIPVVVHGVERTWSKRAASMTALGVRFNNQSKCVGILLPVSCQDLKLFDKREIGYDRFLIDLDKVELYNAMGDADASNELLNAERSLFARAKAEGRKDLLQIWCYVPRRHIPPTEQRPIAQSYVDIVLRGCLHIGGEDFAKSFIATTKGWSVTELKGEIHKAIIQEAVAKKRITDDVPVDKEPPKTTTTTTAKTAKTSKKNTISLYMSKKPVWVNDRMDPIYIRSDPTWSLSKADELDHLLQKYRPTHFRNRKMKSRL